MCAVRVRATQCLVMSRHAFDDYTVMNVEGSSGTGKIRVTWELTLDYLAQVAFRREPAGRKKKHGACMHCC